MPAFNRIRVGANAPETGGGKAAPPTERRLSSRREVPARDHLHRTLPSSDADDGSTAPALTPAPASAPARPRLRPGFAFPWLTVAVSLAAIATQTIPAWAVVCVGERSALAAGEIWRLWTAHLVHFSPSHVVASGLAWIVASAFVERASRASLVALLVAGAPAITIAALGGDRDLGSYGGLSGLAMAAVVWAGLHLCLGPGRPFSRAPGWAILVVAGAKIAAELFGVPGSHPAVWATFDPGAGTPVRVATFAHVAGALAGAGVYSVSWITARRKMRNGPTQSRSVAAPTPIHS